MDRAEKFEIKFQRDKERSIKKFLRKAGVSKNDTPEQVKEKLIKYTAKAKINYTAFRYPDELLADPEFLLAIYKANSDTAIFYPPSFANKELVTNADFMIEYVKLSFELKKNGLYANLYKEMPNIWGENILDGILRKYDTIIFTPDFIDKLSKSFEDINIVPLVKLSFTKCYIIGSREEIKQKEKQDLEMFKKCLTEVNIDVLCNQARKFGCKCIREIPKDIPNFNKIVDAGIEEDGFASLRELDITQVLDNVNLVSLAYSIDGIHGLLTYIKKSLSPYRNYTYCCHGEIHDYVKYEQVYADVQNALLSHPDIKAIIEYEAKYAQQKEELMKAFEEEDMEL